MDGSTTQMSLLFLFFSLLTISVSGFSFECDTVGRFPDLEDTTCQKYYLCSKYLNGTFVKTPYNCPGFTYFDPRIGRCNKYYVCPFTPSITTTTERVTTTERIITTTEDFGEIETTTTPNCVNGSIEVPLDFSCTKKGRFPNGYVDSCKGYFLCSHLRNGTFIKTPYDCPANSIFDPLRGRCSTITSCNYCILQGTSINSNAM